MTPARAFLARMETAAGASGGVGFRTVYFTGTSWSEDRADALEMSIEGADKLGPKVGGVRCLVDDGPSVSAAIAQEHQERLARQGLD